jgi:hypothetical protein
VSSRSQRRRSEYGDADSRRFFAAAEFAPSCGPAPDCPALLSEIVETGAVVRQDKVITLSKTNANLDATGKAVNGSSPIEYLSERIFLKFTLNQAITQRLIASNLNAGLNLPFNIIFVTGRSS